MASTNYKVWFFTFMDGWNPDGSPIIQTHPSKGVTMGHAEERLRRAFPRASLIGQATKEDIEKYKAHKALL